MRGTAAELAARYAGEPPKGEIVLVLGPASRTEPDLRGPLDALRRLIAAGAKPRAAATVVAELTQHQRQRPVPGAHRPARDRNRPRIRRGLMAAGTAGSGLSLASKMRSSWRWAITAGTPTSTKLNSR